MENNKGPYSKPFKDLTISDNYLFCKIMEDEKVCSKLIEILLGIKVSKLIYHKTEKCFDPSYESRGIRLDVFVEDSDRIIDVEMQTSNFSDLPMRARYYQGAMDVTNVKRRTKYMNLKESYILFICTKDPFGYNLPVYKIKNCVYEMPEISYNDKTCKVFYNASAYNNSNDKEIKGFLEYVATRNTTTPFSTILEEKVEVTKQEPSMEDDYMFFQDILEDCKEEARAAGHAEGLEAGLAKGIEEGTRKGIEEGKKKGIEEGLKEGLKEGKKEGIKEGIKEGKISSARKIIAEGICTPEKACEMFELDISDLQ